MMTNGKTGKSRSVRLQGRKASRRLATRKTIRLRRLSRNFSWELLSQLFQCCSSALGDNERSDFMSLLRSRSMSSYRSLSALWVKQCRTAQKDELENNSFTIIFKYQLAQLLLKNPDCSEICGRERRKACLDSVRSLDETLQPFILRDLGDPVFRETKRIISEILGVAPTVHEISECCKHGPGSTATVSYDRRNTYFKYADWPYSCSPGAVTLFKQCVNLDERWLGSLEQSYRERLNIEPWKILDWNLFWGRVIDLTPFNVITTVPKDGTKDRPIAKEPTANVYLQLGLGSIMKERLLGARVNLQSQAENRQLARLASIQDHVFMPATFDLSNASDTIHYDLVRSLLPSDWFRLLDAVRSPYGLFPGQMCWRYAKMSSMGNGTTFELESLLFISLLRAIVRLYGDYRDLPYTNVYGDDLIFPRYLSPIVHRYLSAFGFTVNQSKSFSSGGFFESCGADWLHGVDIRPVYLKGNPRTVSELLSIRNRFNRWFALKLGTCMPTSLDAFFLKYLEGDVCEFYGPESDTDFDTYWHVPHGARYDVRFQCLVPYTKSLSDGDLWFRKLMHNLRHCSSDGGSRFSIDEVGGWRVGLRSQCVRDFYHDSAGLPQDHRRPPYSVLE